jgi:hypothetical protein
MVPVQHANFREARRMIVGCLSYLIPDEGTLVYVGKKVCFLDSEHDGQCDETCPTNKPTIAWLFQENRPW